MTPLRYGIVGGGFVSGFHLRALESVRGIEVAGLTSRTPPDALAESVADALAAGGPALVHVPIGPQPEIWGILSGRETLA